jgi:two-component system, cell cycle sensor histidine kinase and response regulator CckA
LNTIGHEGTAQAGDGRTVLVADDDAAVRGFVATILRGHGYRVLEAQTGDEALRFVEEELALLVADLVMPPEGGLELADALRRQIPGLKVLFISGYGVLSGSSNTVDPVLGKPFSPADLLRRVAELVAPAAVTALSGDRPA